jgi:hypothetical protein
MMCIKRLFLQVVIVVAFASIRSGPVNATFILQVSDFDSNLTLSGPLSASIGFEVSGNQLLTDNNNTSPYTIAPICFNSDATLTTSGFSGSSNFASPIPGAGSSQHQNLNGFSDYNYSGLIGFGLNINRLSLGVTQRIRVLTGIAAIKLEARPNGESTFGAAVTRVPEAVLILLFGVGLVFFAKFVRKGRNRYLRHSRRPEWRTKSQNLGPRASNPADGGNGYPKKFMIAAQRR